MGAKERAARASARAAGLCLLLTASALVAGCGTTKIVTVSQSPAPSATAAETSTTVAPPEPLTVGGTATLKGERSGEKLEATLLGYKASLAVGEYDTPDSGMKYVGVSLRLRNVGTVPYSDSPSNGATILTATGLHGKTTIISSGECSEGFATEVKIAPGESQEGCIPFELAQEDSAARFQWTPASGFGEETAEWSILGRTAGLAAEPAASSPERNSPGHSESRALLALNQYWSDIRDHGFSEAYVYLAPTARTLSESQFVASEQKANIENAQFHGQVTSSSGGAASIDVVSLITHDAEYGCRSWSGSYTMVEESGTWRIAHAAISPQSCSG